MLVTQNGAKMKKENTEKDVTAQDDMQRFISSLTLRLRERIDKESTPVHHRENTAMKWKNSPEHFAYMFLLVCLLLVFLPMWLVTFFFLVTIAFFRRVYALLMRKHKTPKPEPIRFTRAPQIPEPVSPQEYNDLLDPDTDAWEYAILRRQRSHLETCLDYSCPDFIPDYDDDLR